jgi:putative transcriptional regulator
MSKIKEIRERLGVTQQELAEGLNCTQGNVSFLEKGQTLLPDTAKLLIQYAKSKGVDLTFEDVYGAPTEKVS